MAKSKKQRRIAAKDKKAARTILMYTIGILVVLLVFLYIMYQNQ